MIAGHLQEKKGLYYMVLSYKDKSGKRISKWLPTGLPVKGNKKRAEDMLMAARAEFVAGEAAIDRDMPFSSYLVQWMETVSYTHLDVYKRQALIFLPAVHGSSPSFRIRGTRRAPQR